MKILISLHGVRSRGKWQKELGEYINKCGRTDIYYHAYKYGWIPSFYSIIPFIRRYHVNRFRKWLYKRIYPLYGEDIVICSHSFGTYISFHALKDSLGARTLILFGGILHCKESFNGIVPDQIKEIHNFHSKEDQVAQFAPQGHCGFFGFRNKNTKSKKWKRKPYKDREIINHRCFVLDHDEYFPSKFSDILKLL